MHTIPKIKYIGALSGSMQQYVILEPLPEDTEIIRKKPRYDGVHKMRMLLKVRSGLL